MSDPDSIDYAEASRHTGRAVGTIKAWCRDIPALKSGRGRVSFERLKAEIERREAKDFRSMSRLQAPRIIAAALPATDAPPEPMGGASTFSDLGQLRIAKERAAVDRATMQNMRQARQLIRLDDATAVLTGLAAAARTRLESMAVRLSGDLEGRGRLEIEMRIRAEVEAALAELSQGLTAINEAFT